MRASALFDPLDTSPLSSMLHALLLAALAPSDVVPPTLQATDLAYGSSTSLSPFVPSTHLGLVPGDPLVFRLGPGAGSAGLPAVLFASPNQLDSPISLGQWSLLIDPTTSFVIAPGVVPSAPGTLDWPVTVPPSAPLGTVLYTQAAVLDPGTGVVQTTNRLSHVVTDAAPTVLAQFAKTAHPLGATFVGGTLVVESAVQWDAEWASAGLPGSPPDVDFMQSFVVMHFAGRKPTTGFSVTIDALTPLFPGVQVETTLVEPDPTCAVGFGETSPACFAAVDRVAAGAPLQSLETPVLSPPCP